MNRVNAALLRDVFIAIGVFVPLLDYVHHLLQTYASPVNVFLLPSGEQFMLLALTMVPLVVLRLVFAPQCRVRPAVTSSNKNNNQCR